MRLVIFLAVFVHAQAKDLEGLGRLWKFDMPELRNFHAFGCVRVTSFMHGACRILALGQDRYQVIRILSTTFRRFFHNHIRTDLIFFHIRSNVLFTTLTRQSLQLLDIFVQTVLVCVYCLISEAACLTDLQPARWRLEEINWWSTSEILMFV